MEKNNKIKCCFTGHRPQSLPCGYNEEHPACIKIKSQLKKLIIGLINKKNVTHFISGGALGVDMWAMEIVIELKRDFPNISLEAAVPCKSQDKVWNTESKKRYNKLLSLCDRVTVLQENYTADCMMKRNIYMVDNSNYIVAVWNGRPSGTRKTAIYAIGENKPVYYIDTKDFKIKAL